MKRTISLLSALAFVLAFSGNALAQPDITASASIVQDLTFNKVNDLNFGQISNSQSTDAVLNPNGTDSNVGNTTSYGELEITGATNSTLVISFSNPAALDDGSGSTITFSPDYSGATSSGAGSSTDLNTGSNNTVTTDGTSGKYFIYYGGTLTGSDIQGATTGNYSATISTTVNYQ